MKLITLFVVAAFGALACESAAQTVQTSQPDRTVIPLAEPNFEGKIGETYKDSEGGVAQVARAAQGAPNVLLIMLDDVGFGQTGTFGGPIPTPALDQLAANGLRYTRFHTTAICGPSRAALITGAIITTAAPVSSRNGQRVSRATTT